MNDSAPSSPHLFIARVPDIGRHLAKLAAMEALAAEVLRRSHNAPATHPLRVTLPVETIWKLRAAFEDGTANG
jgi:hypothetical protein